MALNFRLFGGGWWGGRRGGKGKKKGSEGGGGGKSSIIEFIDIINIIGTFDLFHRFQC